MQKGLNSDVSVRGQSFHVQTEDWGDQNPFLVSRIYLNGAVIKTIKTSYEEAFRQGSVRDLSALQGALKKQHHRILDQLFAGEFTR